MGRHKFKTRCWIRREIPENLSTSDVRWVVKSGLEITSFPEKQQSLTRLWLQIDMSKCMVAFIDWYHDNIDGERTKVKVSISFQLFCGHLSLSALWCLECQSGRPSHPWNIAGLCPWWGALHLWGRQWWAWFMSADRCQHSFLRPLVFIKCENAFSSWKGWSFSVSSS